MKRNERATDWRLELRHAVEQLRDPQRMRIAVALIMVAVMFFAISEPLHGKSKRGRRELEQFRQKVRTAEEVVLLRKSLDAIDPRIIQGEGNDRVTRFFMDLFRDGNAELVQINPEAPQRLGPIYCVRVTVDLAGQFDDLNEAIYRIESRPELIRIETLQITPGERGDESAAMQLSIRLLKELE